MTGCFITGTDTEVGKTRISAALLHILAQQGLRVAGVKPVAAGMAWVDGQWMNEDVQALHAASSPPLAAGQVGLHQLRTGCAPHIAAQLEGVVPDRAAWAAQVRATAAQADAVVIEGAGGFCVPLSPIGDLPRWGLDDLAADLRLPVVLVVALRLGCLNHALLTAQAIAARGLRLAGWVGNRAQPQAMPFEAENVATLREWLSPAPCLGVVPWLADPAPPQMAAALDAGAVARALAPSRCAA
jgi:dethiobiotin synthetase